MYRSAPSLLSLLCSPFSSATATRTTEVVNCKWNRQCCYPSVQAAVEGVRAVGLRARSVVDLTTGGSEIEPQMGAPR